MEDPLFPPLRLGENLVRDLRRLNPWWEGDAARPLPDTQRHLVRQIRRRLDSGLAPIVVVPGPRQIGKTTAQLQVVQQRLREGLPGQNVLRVPFDQLGGLESLESTIEAGVFSLTEVGLFRGIDLGEPFLADNGLAPLADSDFWRSLESHGRTVSTSRDEAFARFAERGGYPLAHTTDEAWGVVADQLNENVIKRVIQHDLRAGDGGQERDPQLLEEVFRLCCAWWSPSRCA